MLLNLLFFVLAGATLSLLLWSGFELLSGSQEDPLSDRLEGLQSQAMVSTTRSTRRKAAAQGLDRALYFISLIPGGDDWMNGVEKLLSQAGIRRKSSLAMYCIFVVVFTLSLFAGTIYMQRATMEAASLAGGLLAAGIIGFILPKQILYRLVKSYRRKLQEALPDTVDLLGIVLGTGLGLDQAMMRVSEEMRYIYPELANEFTTVVMQVRAGQERGKSFNQFVRRTGIEDIKSLSAMIVQSEKFGTSLGQALKVYADALRTRRRLRVEAEVGKAGIKMLFPIVVFILPVLFVITLVPGMLSVFANLKLLGGGR